MPRRAGTRASSIRRHWKILVLLGLFVGAAIFVYSRWTQESGAVVYVTDRISRGSVEVNVSATGTVQAVTTVQVGSQVSGTVSWLGADFKSHVKQGQVIARLDPALFQAQVDTARANLLNAQAGVQAAMTDIKNQQANIEAAKANDQANAAARDDAVALAKRNDQLKGIIPDRDIEATSNAARVAVARYNQASSQIGQAEAQLKISQSKLKQSKAEVAQARAQLAQAQVNLDHTTIASPIDGVVVSRNVDVGQTVAASLQAPTLFTIANDLKQMQVLGSIDEADVGEIREGGKATFTVDAFPDETFTGDIIQIRLNAQTLQNVVTYTAVISVANPDEKLMPGMTANIIIQVAKRDNVLRVPNAALRFTPNLSDQQQKDLTERMDLFRKQQEEELSQEQQKPESIRQAQGNRQQRRNQSLSETKQLNANQNRPAEVSSSVSSQRQFQIVWIWTARKTLDPHFIRTGITDGRVTEIVAGDIKEGDQVIIGQTGGSSSNSNGNQRATSPLSPRPPAGTRVR